MTLKEYIEQYKKLHQSIGWPTNFPYGGVPPEEPTPTEATPAESPVLVGQSWRLKASGYVMTIKSVTGDKATVDYGRMTGVEMAVKDITDNCEKVEP